MVSYALRQRTSYYYTCCRTIVIERINTITTGNRIPTNGNL
jgi:hypothetical protein